LWSVASPTLHPLAAAQRIRSVATMNVRRRELSSIASNLAARMLSQQSNLLATEDAGPSQQHRADQALHGCLRRPVVDSWTSYQCLSECWEGHL
jgi:hypothetical protein